MRFLIATLVFGLAALAYADAHGEQEGEKKKRKKLRLVYDWGISLTDSNIGRDTQDDDELKVRAIKNYLDLEVKFKKSWDSIDLKISHDLITGLESAVVTAELPRSYLSVSLGKGLLDVGGWQEYSSPYLSYHKPFPAYGMMGRVFAPIEGFGELSLMIVDDVTQGEDDKKDARWHNDDKSITGLMQYKGDFGMVSPLLQFAMYDFNSDNNWWHSWVMTAGAKLSLDDLTVHLDYIRDNRKNTDGNDEYEDSTTVYNSYTAGVYYQHSMLSPWASFSMFMAENDDERYGNRDGNLVTPSEDEGDSYQEMLKKTFGEDAKSYDDLKKYHKYSSNMMIVNIGTYINCVEDKLLPYISYTMAMHKIDPRWDEADSETENQIGHSIAFGVAGAI